MNKIPFFSIIIPVKGRLQYCKEALNSVYKQKNIDSSCVEVLVVENKNSGEIIRDKIKKLYPKVQIVINSHENYAGGSRNSGLEKATGKFIVFLDSDDCLHPDFLSKMSEELEKDRLSAAAVCFSQAIFESGYSRLEYFKWRFLMMIRDLSLIFFCLFQKGYLIPSAFYLCQISHMMFKKETLKNMKFDYTYRFGGEDWNFINRVQEKGKIRIVSKMLTFFRYSNSSITALSLYRRQKWQSYLHLAENLSAERKKGIYYQLFLAYIKLFRTR